MRYLFFVGLFGFFSLSALGQTITVRNSLNPDAPIARDSLALIEGTAFTTVSVFDPFTMPMDSTTTTLGGVSVTIDGIPQRIRFVSPTQVEIVVSGAGRASRALQLRTSTNVIHNTSINVASVWPSLPVQNTGDESDAYYPAGYWTIDPLGGTPTFFSLTSAPIPVGTRSNPTKVFIEVSGLRRRGSGHGVSVRLNGIQCTVVMVGPSFFAGQNVLTFEIPFFLAGNGVMDLIIAVDGRSSNLARLNLGGSAGLTGN
ncbi:MAG: hypothetical protein ABI977_32085 [Acidobacteriota bacterium]